MNKWWLIWVHKPVQMLWSELRETGIWAHQSSWILSFYFLEKRETGNNTNCCSLTVRARTPLVKYTNCNEVQNKRLGSKRYHATQQAYMSNRMMFYSAAEEKPLMLIV